MTNSKRIRLYRSTPPWSKTVTVRQITVGGFLELARLLAHRSALLVLNSKRSITAADIISSVKKDDLAAFADLIVDGEVRMFWRRWATKRNNGMLMDVSGEVDDWPLMLKALNFDGKRSRPGSLVSDIQQICRIFPGLDPLTIEKSWPMEYFLRFCEGLSDEARAVDPTVDTRAQASPAAAFMNIKGIGVQ